MRTAHVGMLGKVLALGLVAGAVACVVESAPREECRTIVRRRADVETCITRCNEDTCRTKCREQERWSREHRCWME